MTEIRTEDFMHIKVINETGEENSMLNSEVRNKILKKTTQMFLYILS